MSQGAMSEPERILRLAPGGGGDRPHEADRRLVLKILAGGRVWKSRQHRSGGGGVAGSRQLDVSKLTGTLSAG